MTDKTASRGDVTAFRNVRVSFHGEVRQALRAFGSFVVGSLGTLAVAGLAVTSVMAGGWVVAATLFTKPHFEMRMPAGPTIVLAKENRAATVAQAARAPVDANASAQAMTFEARWAAATIVLDKGATRVAAQAAAENADAVPLPPARPLNAGNDQAKLALARLPADNEMARIGVESSPASARPQKSAPQKQAQNNAAVMPAHDSRTAVYDISARTVYMPNGEKLEAHSGLGDKKDDPRYVHVRMRGATPPNVYNLTLRETLFHGVRALRLNPVDEDKMHGRDGILAHTYMLGPSGQSNGCVSFKDYPKFLRAYLKGEVTRIVVVPSLDGKTSVASRGRGRTSGRYASNNPTEDPATW